MKSDFKVLLDNITSFLNAQLPDLEWYFYSDTPNSNIVIREERKKLKLRIHFVFDNKFRNNPPNYNLPFEFKSIEKVISYLDENGLYFIVIKCYGNINNPRQFYMDRYTNIPNEELELVSRHGKRMDRIQVHSHEWYQNKMKPVGYHCENLMKEIIHYINDENK